jgi:Ulp1 family protease
MGKNNSIPSSTADPKDEQILQLWRRNRARDNEVVAKIGGDSVVQRAFKSLIPGALVIDEVILFFMRLLERRDETLCQHNNSSRKRCHFFSSHLIGKLMNEEVLDHSLRGSYQDNNVQPWLNRVPGGD